MIGNKHASWRFSWARYRLPLLANCGPAKYLNKAPPVVTSFNPGPAGDTPRRHGCERQGRRSASADLQQLRRSNQDDVKVAGVGHLHTRLGVQDLGLRNATTIIDLQRPGRARATIPAVEIDRSLRSKATRALCAHLTEREVYSTLIFQASCEATLGAEATCNLGSLCHHSFVIAPADQRACIRHVCNANAVCEGTSEAAAQCEAQVDATCQGTCMGTARLATGAVTENDANCREVQTVILYWHLRRLLSCEPPPPPPHPRHGGHGLRRVGHLPRWFTGTMSAPMRTELPQFAAECPSPRITNRVYAHSRSQLALPAPRFVLAADVTPPSDCCSESGRGSHNVPKLVSCLSKTEACRPQGPARIFRQVRRL